MGIKILKGRAFNERDKSESPGFASELVGLFLSDVPAPGIATEFELAKPTLSPFNRAAPLMTSSTIHLRRGNRKAARRPAGVR